MTKEDQILQELKEHRKILNEHTRILNEHSKTLNEHSRILNEHSKTLNEHSRILNEHSKTLNQHTRILNEHSKKLSEHDGLFDRITKTLDAIHRSIIVIEDDTHNKIPALFDAHFINKEHIERNDESIEKLQEKTENHSNRIISLEINSEKHTKQLNNLVSSN